MQYHEGKIELLHAWYHDILRINLGIRGVFYFFQGSIPSICIGQLAAFQLICNLRTQKNNTHMYRHPHQSQRRRRRTYSIWPVTFRCFLQRTKQLLHCIGTSLQFHSKNYCIAILASSRERGSSTHQNRSKLTNERDQLGKARILRVGCRLWRHRYAQPLCIPLPPLMISHNGFKIVQGTCLQIN